MCENGVSEEQQEINHKAMSSQSSLASSPSAQSGLRTLHFLPAYLHAAPTPSAANPVAPAFGVRDSFRE